MKTKLMKKRLEDDIIVLSHLLTPYTFIHNLLKTLFLMINSIFTEYIYIFYSPINKTHYLNIGLLQTCTILLTLFLLN